MLRLTPTALSTLRRAMQGTTPIVAAAAIVSTQRCFIGGDSKNPYTILGIKPGSSKEQIKKAYRLLARKHHPDAGGSHEKFQEIQSAYEQVKTGVWVKKGGDGSDGAAQSGGTGNRYEGFRYTTRAHKSEVSYDDFYAEMHGGQQKKGMDFDDDEATEAAKKKARRSPLGNERLVEAWFRFITLWAVLFVSLRVTLFLLFPPKHQSHRKPMQEKTKKPPPPKPLTNSPMIA